MGLWSRLCFYAQGMCSCNVCHVLVLVMYAQVVCLCVHMRMCIAMCMGKLQGATGRVMRKHQWQTWGACWQ